MHLHFRWATEKDAEALHELIQAAFVEYRGRVAVPPGALNDTVEDARRAAAQGHTVLASCLPDLHGPGNEALDLEAAVPVGTARYEPRDEHLYVGRVAVHPQYRRQGVGAALMAYMEGIAATLGYTRLYLGTRQSMPGNVAFYERLGYRIVKREPHPRGPDTLLWFEKELAGGSLD